jgi:hypothetical protein
VCDLLISTMRRPRTDLSCFLTEKYLKKLSANRTIILNWFVGKKRTEDANSANLVQYRMRRRIVIKRSTITWGTVTDGYKYRNETSDNSERWWIFMKILMKLLCL